MRCRLVGIACVTYVAHHRSGGVRDLPDQALAADLAQALAAATHPHGPIRTYSVAAQ
jgi:hypothetical protein